MTETVSVTLPSAIIYVVGSVNGADVTFALTGANVWSATCPKADNDIYVVTIQAFDAAGNQTNYSLKLFYGLHLVTDRTGGYYRADDLNRVGAAMLYVADRLHECGYAVTVSPKCDYVVRDIPTRSQMTKYLADLQALKDAYVVYATTPLVPPDMDSLKTREANDIEQILQDIDSLITNMIAAYNFSGELYSGEV